jgi:hypothetical protein
MSSQAPTEYQKLLDDRGVSLDALGLGDVALERDDALRAVELLKRASVPILGGDVYFKQASVIKLALANWHTDHRPAEDRDHFLARSWEDTIRYITGFPSRADVLPLFSLVLGK